MNARAIADNVNRWIYRRFVFLYLLLAVAGYSTVYIKQYADYPIRSDGLGYYSYLPALFVYRDVGMRKVYRIVHKQAPCLYQGLKPKRYFDKYPMGEAMMMVPFFLVADLLTILFRYERDGFSVFYQHAAGLSGVAYSALGIYFLRKILDKYFSAAISLAVLVAITFGTDLFHYGTYDSIFSHAYSFFLFCVFFDCIPRWIENPNRRRSTVLGLIFGMICLTRNPNALILVYASLFVLCTLPNFKARLDFVRCNYKNIVRIGILSILVFIPQLCYWKFATGKWLVDSYGSQGEHFNFLTPHLMVCSLVSGRVCSSGLQSCCCPLPVWQE